MDTVIHINILDGIDRMDIHIIAIHITAIPGGGKHALWNGMGI